MSWLKKKIIIMKCCLILCNNNHSWIGLWRVMKSGFYMTASDKQPAQWLDQETALKHFPKPNLYQKKVLVTVQWSTAGLIHYSFLNPSKTITSKKYAQQIGEMHWNLHFAGTTFCRENASIASRMQKMPSKSLLNPVAWIFTLQEEANIFHWQKCVDCSGSYFD